MLGDEADNERRETATHNSDTSYDTTKVKPLHDREIPKALSVKRVGVGGSLNASLPIGFHAAPLRTLLRMYLPRVELFKPHDSLADSITWSELQDESNEFMRGIFYYAGLDARSCQSLFTQTDRTDRRITEASNLLNKTLRESWQQGERLEFRLSSRGARIELQIQDPSVLKSYVRPSRRSSGFTHFFTLKTTLHARRKEHTANSYVYLFDEPGIYLHPSGQYDLLRALEVVGQADQVVYSTHSIFMINRTFPARHRLVVKDAQGTKMDVKPYVGRWGAAFDALGVSLSGTALFATYLLFTEGDSEPILIPAMLQALMAAGQGDKDINALAVMGMGDSARGEALIRTFLEAQVHPKLAVLVDGDQGGKDRIKDLKPLLGAHNIKHQALHNSTAIEDYLPLASELYPKAVALYITKLLDDSTRNEEISEAVQQSFTERGFAKGKVTQGIADWGQDIGAALVKRPQGISKIGIAREYVTLLVSTPQEKLTPTTLQRTKDLLRMIDEMLDLPSVVEVNSGVLNNATSGNDGRLK